MVKGMSGLDLVLADPFAVEAEKAHRSHADGLSDTRLCRFDARLQRHRIEHREARRESTGDLKKTNSHY